MANPYHDGEGKFCSRDGMIAAIDQAALSGDVKKYLELREEFDKIDQERNVVIPKDEYERLVSGEDNESQVDVASLDSATVSEIVGDLVHEPNPDFDKVHSILKSHNFQKDILYSAVTPGTKLDHSQIVQLLREADNDEAYSYPFSSTFNSSRGIPLITSAYRQDFIDAAKRLGEKPTEENEYARHLLSENIASTAQSSEDIDIAIAIHAWDSYANTNERTIVESPHCNNKQAAEVLHKSMVYGGRRYPEVRHALTKRLREIGYPVKDMDYETKVRPLPGEPPKDIQDFVERYNPENRTSSKTSRLFKESLYADMRRMTDSYEENRLELQRILKNNREYTPHAREAKRRIQNSDEYLKNLRDYHSFHTEITSLDF
jgi:hypothetical protein